MGANDGIISTASLLVGVAAAGAGIDAILTAGIAAVIAGAMSMAAGEYVSVSAQRDSVKADLDWERAELDAHPHAELDELATIYEHRGVDPDVARLVARQLMARDALDAHARDEIGLTEVTAARPVAAALVSALTFSVGGLLPVLTTVALPPTWLMPGVTGVALGMLVVLGFASARTGGAAPARATVRVVFWGALAMAVTAAIGRLVGLAHL